MNYKLYTLVDISHTGQKRYESNKEVAWRKEQNFNTMLQTLGLRSNIHYDISPQLLEVGGKLVGFDTDEVIRVWRFDWYTEQDLYSKDGDPVAFLKQDFNLIPYINGLDEMLDQKIPVFTTNDPGRNIVFFLKQ
jgi:hypothetical protein